MDSEPTVVASISVRAEKVLYQREPKSYSEQAEEIRSGFHKDASKLLVAYPKPSKDAQASAPGAHRIPGTDIYAAPLHRPILPDLVPAGMSKADLERQQRFTKFWRVVGLILVHTVSLLGCWSTFSWPMLAGCVVVTVLQSCIGIALTYHRMLTHRSFKVPRVIEYTFAYIGTLAVQGSPIEWVSHHRWHHLHCDTPLDPHSPYEGILHAHFGWLLKDDPERPFLDRSNVQDLTSQPFYRFLEKTWLAHCFARLFICMYFGPAATVWLTTIPVFLSWNFAWIVNSACHLWGDRPYDTGDLSTDNWLVNLVAFGDGYHNTHHAFGYSARHGLKWYQFDPCWYIIWTLSKFGLAWDIRLPTERDLERKRIVPGKTKTK